MISMISSISQSLEGSAAGNTLTGRKLICYSARFKKSTTRTDLRHSEWVHSKSLFQKAFVMSLFSPQVYILNTHATAPASEESCTAFPGQSCITEGLTQQMHHSAPIKLTGKTISILS